MVNRLSELFGMRIHAILLTAILIVSAGAVGTTGAMVPAQAADTGVADRPAHQPTNETDGPIPVEPAPGELEQPTAGEVHAAANAVSTADTESSATAAGDGMLRQFYTSQTGAFTQFERRGVGDNIEIWVATNLSWPADDPRADPSVSDRQVNHLISEFDEKIYPNESEVFGTPAARDGVDSPLSEAGYFPSDYYNTADDAGNKTALLVTNIVDENYYNASYPVYTAGYYSPTTQQYSDRNVITVDAANWDDLDGETEYVGIEGTLAHEYQHLIHGDYDSDETSWINEGMSDYAENVVGYPAPESHVTGYEQNPSNSLINWGDQGDINILADYGEAYAFQLYLVDRFGEEFVSELFANEANGIESVEQTLDANGISADFADVYQQFAVAAALDGKVKNPKDAYQIDGIDLNLNTSKESPTASAWGTAYQEYDTSEKGPIKDVSVSGTDYLGTQWQTTTDPVAGEGEVLYSGSGDLLDRFAITEADLSNTDDTTLTFETNYAIEQNWDYGFVQVSTDGGETWTSLSNENTVSETADGAHPRVQENVPGFSGSSDGWTKQTFDLSAYEGQEVLIGFRYTTDWATQEDGWYLKNVSVGDKRLSGDSTEPFMSLREAQQKPIDYQYSIVGIKHNGKAKVKHLDLKNFEASDEQDLKKFLHNGNFEKVIVAATWAANTGESGRVPVGVDLSFAHE